MTWETLTTLTLIGASVALGASLASYGHARTGRKTNPNHSLALAFICSGLVLNTAVSGSRVVAVLGLVLLVAAVPIWYRGLKPLSRNAA